MIASYWIEDIEQLAIELPKKHKNLFFEQTEEMFCNKIAQLKKNIDDYEDLKVVTEISKIVASIHDAHTAIVPLRMNQLPFKCYWFSEGIYIISTLEKYCEILHCKIIEINGIAIEDVIEMLRKVISYENKAFLMAQLPDYIVSAEILFGLDILDSFEDVEIKLQTLEGEAFYYNVPLIKASQYQDEKEKTVDNVDDLPLYRRNSNLNYWKTLLKDEKVLYFKYNKCKDMPEDNVKEFCEELMLEIVEKEVEKLVIDIRNNGGGDSTLLEPFIESLCNCVQLKEKGRIYVIVGRDTFSSALLNVYALKYNTKAIFVGEPSGGKPNCYGEVQYLKLKNSGLMVRYSTKFYKLIKDDEIMSFYPKISYEVTMKDYMSGKDSCLEYILGFKI